MVLHSQSGGTLGDVAPRHEAIPSALCAICCLHQVPWVLVALPWCSSMLLVSLLEAPAASREVLLNLGEISIILHSLR